MVAPRTKLAGTSIWVLAVAVSTLSGCAHVRLPAIDPTGLLWWLVLANDGGTLEGPWGQNSSGNDRSGPGADGSSGECGVTSKTLAADCD